MEGLPDALHAPAPLLFIVYCLALGVAAVIDARERRVPNALALAMACLGFVYALCFRGSDARAATFSVVAAFAVCGVLVAIELFWRRWRGCAGIGMGDVKVLFSALLMSGFAALVAFAVGLLALAVCAVARHKTSLPLMPFFCASFLAVHAMIWFLG